MEKQYNIVVRPNYCQSLKIWTTRVINEKGECINSFSSKDKAEIEKEWKYLMKKYHNLEDAIWQQQFDQPKPIKIEFEDIDGDIVNMVDKNFKDLLLD
jgi:hypothetical protein